MIEPGPIGCPSDSIWRDFLDESATQSGYESLVAHLNACERCQEVVERLLSEDASFIRIVRSSSQSDIDVPKLSDYESQRQARQPLPVLPGFEVVRYIGRGGMGVVYEAIQAKPLERRVAIKVMHSGTSSSRTAERFEREKQTLAKLAEPNIAQIFASGTLADGRLYFVMEFVDGITLSEFCRSSQASLQTRLELMIQVCIAVQSAHNKRIIHRDLKPENILVVDAPTEPMAVHRQPQAKIIDFGLAKSLTEFDSSFLEQTQAGSVLGSIRYMSPEQAQGAGESELDSTTDVYSLGVICYELLTGTSPLLTSRSHASSLESILREIREVDAVRPSALIATAEVDAIAGHLEQLKLTRQPLVTELRSDLDWIVLKAIEKDPKRRYQTADALATDLVSYLNNQPVQARPPSVIYAVRKFYRRNRVLSWSIAAVVLSIIGGGLGTVSALLLAWENARIAELRAAELGESLVIMREVIDQMNPEAASVNQRLMTLALLERLGTRLQEAILGEADEVLLLRMSVADALMSLNKNGEAIGLLEGIVKTCRDRFGSDDENTRAAELNLAKGYLGANRLQEAQDIFWERFQTYKKQLGEEALLTQQTAHYVAVTQAAGGHDDLALQLYDRIFKRYQPDPAAPDPVMIDARHQRGQILMRQQEYKQAKDTFQAAFAECMSIPNIPEHHPMLMRIENDLALAEAKLGEVEPAIERLRRLLAKTEQQYPADSIPVGKARITLATTLANAGQFPEAIKLLRENSATQVSPEYVFRSQVIEAQTLQKQGNIAAADGLLQRIKPLIAADLGTEHEVYKMLLALTNATVGKSSQSDLRKTFQETQIVC